MSILFARALPQLGTDYAPVVNSCATCDIMLFTVEVSMDLKVVRVYPLFYTQFPGLTNDGQLFKQRRERITIDIRDVWCSYCELPFVTSAILADIHCSTTRFNRRRESLGPDLGSQPQHISSS